jgi:uncharacterized membrane protein YkvA (DUF1232 family)
MLAALKEMGGFLKAVVNDERIPERDKQILGAMVVLVISPIDLIPDWIPIFGQIDDLVLIALILDYFFTVLDEPVLLSHWPWDMKKFVALKRFAKTIGLFAPNFLKKKIWNYVGAPY